MVMLLRLGELLLVLVMASNCSPVGLSGWCPTVLRDCEQSLDLVVSDGCSSLFFLLLAFVDGVNS